MSVGATAETPSSTTLGADRKPRKPATHVVRFHKVTSADGTVIEAWSNDAEGPDGAAVQRPRHQPLHLA